MLCSINWTNFIAWLPLLREILSNMCIVISFSDCDVIKFETDLTFLIKPFFCGTKKEQKIRYLKDEKRFFKDFQLSEIVSELRVRL